MSHNVLLADSEISDAAVLSGGNATAELPLANLQTLQPREKWRTVNAGDDKIVADLGTARPINLVALMATNFTSAATWRIRGADTEANLVTAPGYDSGVLNFHGQTIPAYYQPAGFLYLATAETWRWWRIDYADSANPDGYLQAGRLYIDAAWQPRRNLSFGGGLGVIEDSRPETTRGGQQIPDPRTRRREVRFDLDFMDQADAYGKALDLTMRRGKSQDVLFMENPEAGAPYRFERSVYGLMKALRPAVNRAFNIHVQPFRIEELI